MPRHERSGTEIAISHQMRPNSLDYWQPFKQNKQTIILIT